MTEKQAVVTPDDPDSAKLGTFGGVFTPSILTILGVIMYLRFGWVVGNVGLLGSLLVVTMAVSITFLTSLSIASIATDQKVRIGGAYYMISRSLGIEAGGAIGIPLYFALTFSVALYTVGFAESVVNVFPMLSQRWVGVITTIAVAVLAMISAKAAIKAQYVIMTAIGISLVCLVFGSPIEQSNVEMWGASGGQAEPFWTVFAVFFPAVTGIMAGVNMSGDLKNPSKSIPWGTFYAIGAGYLIYMALPIILAARADATTLIEDPLVMRRIAVWGDSILLGVWGATLSSAVGSILGGPRILQALARDNILPRSISFLGQGAGHDDTPRYGTVLTLIVVLPLVWLGDLNLIAPILTMFFLATYAVLNIAAGLERFLDSPSFRPEFKVHWIWSLLGAVGCISAMVLVNLQATLVAAAVIFAIFVVLERRELESVWGDLRTGFWMSVTRGGLMRIDDDMDPKSWRPHPLVLSGSPTKRWPLVEFSNALTHDRGILTIASILTDETISPERIKEMQVTKREFLNDRGVQALVKVITAEGLHEGATELVKSYGIGPLVPNTIIVGTNQREEKREAYFQMLREIHRQNRNLIVLNERDEEPVFGDQEEIHLWWGGLRGNGGLMLILAYMLQSGIDWRNAEVHLKMVIDDKGGREEARRNLIAITEEIRIGAEVDIHVREGRDFGTILHDASDNADLIIMGMAEPDDDFPDYYHSMLEQTENLPTSILVLAAEDISFGEVLIQEDTMQ
jgi:amino acid transporter